MSEFEQKVISELSALRTDMKSLVGNGQPGRITLLENDVQSLRESRSWFLGAVFIVAAVGSWLSTHLFGGK